MNGFNHNIYNWYKLNKRDLPWRKTNDAYKIWLSEVILQQTRVVQGTNYYLSFVKRFPTVKHLAQANEDEVLKLWQGLGYYSRARNLHATAKTIVKEFNCNFPDDYKNILGLKGIGPYTAAAIASIAFNLPYPTVDGNVYRVFSRYFGIRTPIDSTQGKKEFQELAEQLISSEDPGMHNQAIMEFGALQCTPKSPACKMCPLNNSCYALQNNAINELPVKTKKTKQSHRFFYYYLIDDGVHIYINKRTKNDIWKNLHELPLFESAKAKSKEELLNDKIPFLEEGAHYNIRSISDDRKHILSHQLIHAKCIYVEVNNNVNITAPLLRVNKKDISKFAVPRLLELFFEEYNLAHK